MKRSFVAVMLLATCALFGCSDPYGGAAKASDAIAKSINSGLTTVLKLEQQGQLSPAETLDIAGYLEYANTANGAFETCITAVHTSGAATGYTACAQTLDTSLTAPDKLALIHATNTTSLQTVNVIVNGLTTGAQAVILALGGK